MRGFVKLRMYFRYFGAEVSSPVNYAIAAGIGAAILLLQGSGPLSSPIPYIVPVLVQSFSKSYLRYTHRHSERLLSLPGKRSDPAFIMDRRGNVLLSYGYTHRNFTEGGVQSLRDLLGPAEADRILSAISTEEGGREFNAYSPLFAAWYEVKVSSEPKQEDVLVWFRDITKYHRIDETMEQVREYGNQIIEELPQLVEHDSSLERLAPLFLALGYQAVFIARAGAQYQLHGRVYKEEEGELHSSEPIAVSQESAAPIWASRQENRVIYAERDRGESEDEFVQRYPVDPRVRSFLDSSVENFVNYHEGEVSVIAFNLQRRIVPRDLVAMEVLVNNARSVTRMVSYAKENERRFLQAVQGLCAAAEFSDEITGRHIWRVNEYARMLAGDLGFSREETKYIGQVAAMHDIGKIAIPEIIKLERRLSPEERSRMEMHTAIGAQIIRTMISCCGQEEQADTRLSMAGEIALSHHQNWDGSGYPRIVDRSGNWVDPLSVSEEEYRSLRPLKGEEIPLSARIVALADTYDALRSERQYKPAFSHNEVIKLIRRDERSGIGAAERFGPDLAEIFERRQGRMAEIYQEFS